MKNKRITLSPSKRFEVLKRDGFRCQYCGRHAPDVELEVDHIVPVSQGGSNRDDNLITSCHDCNIGKGRKLLTEIELTDHPLNPSFLMKQLFEKEKRLKEINIWRLAEDELLEEQVCAIQQMLFDISKCYMEDYQWRTVQQKICKYGFERVFKVIREEALKNSSDENSYYNKPSFLYLMSAVEHVCSQGEKE